MTDYQQLEPAEAEQAIFTRLHVWDDAMKLTGPQLGLMAHDVQDRALWRHREGCTSFSDWLRRCCPHGYSTVRGFMRDVDDLKDVPQEDLAGVLQENVGTLKQLSTGVQTQTAVLDAAKTMPKREFEKFIQGEHPDQHISLLSPRRFNFTSEDRAEIDECIEAAIAMGFASTAEGVVLGWAVEYKQGLPIMPEFELMTKRVQ